MKNKNIFIVAIFLLVGGITAILFLWSRSVEPINIPQNDGVSVKQPNTVLPNEGESNTGISIEQMELIDPSDPYVTVNEEMAKVNFCSDVYYTKQIVVDGVDVVKRLAELDMLENRDFKKYFCEFIANNQSDGTISVTIENVVYDRSEQKEPPLKKTGEYNLTIEGLDHNESFFISVVDNVINYNGGFAPVQVGTLK